MKGFGMLIESKNMETEKTLPEITRDIELTSFEDKDEILRRKELWHEAGYRQYPDGNWLISMYCPMPGVTADMVNWWFWWHPQASERYQSWFPGEHFSITTDKKDKDYFSSPSLPAFQPNTQYPVEKVGSVKMPLRIDFVTPEGFGFSPEAVKDSSIATIVNGHVGAFKGAIYHTEMAHMFFQEEGGLLLVTRFWMGMLLKNKAMRKAILTEETAKCMTIHCMREYRNLCEMLPGLYRENT